MLCCNLRRCKDCLCGDRTLVNFLADLKTKNLTNKERLYRAYRHAASTLEYGRRTKLPACVALLIKNMFPDDKYVGYRDTVSRSECLRNLVHSVSEPLVSSSNFAVCSAAVEYVYALEQAGARRSNSVFRAFLDAR